MWDDLWYIAQNMRLLGKGDNSILQSWCSKNISLKIKSLSIWKTSAADTPFFISELKKLLSKHTSSSWRWSGDIRCIYYTEDSQKNVSGFSTSLALHASFCSNYISFENWIGQKNLYASWLLKFFPIK